MLLRKLRKKTLLALISCVTAITLLAGCSSKQGSSEQGSEGGSEHDSGQGASSDEPDSEEYLIDRPDPTIDATAEEFRDMLGYSFHVPEGAQNIYYYIDTDTNVGQMQFDLNGVSWIASALKRDMYIPLSHPNIPEDAADLRCDFQNEPAMKVHGADPDVLGFYTKDTADWAQYQYSANWYLESEGYSVSLYCYSPAPIDSMPVEVFDFE